MINIKEFGGIAIEDAGWDDYRPVEPEKRRFSDLAYEMFNPPATEPWKAAITTTTTTTPAPLSKTIKKFYHGTTPWNIRKFAIFCISSPGNHVFYRILAYPSGIPTYILLNLYPQQGDLKG